MEFDFLPEFDGDLQALFAANIPKWHSEVRKLLPQLPERIDIQFDNQFLVPSSGVGGFALNSNKIALSYDIGFRGDRENQFLFLRGTYYHECYHAVQGFVGNERSHSLPALSYAIYEGLATKFEILRAGVTPEWGTYPDQQTMLRWLTQVKTLPAGYDWRKWKINDKENETWVLFKLGTFIADQALRSPNVRIEMLVNKKPEEILSLAKLSA